MFKRLLTGLLLTASAMALRADINHDGTVNLADLAILQSEWLMTDTYGPELVANEDFASASGWTLGNGWVIFAESLQHNGGNTASASQSLEIASGYTYRVRWTDASVFGIGYTVTLGGTPITGYAQGTANTFDVVAGSDDTLLKFTGDGVGNSYVIDDVSVQLVIPAGALVTETTPGQVTVKFAVPLGHEPGDYALLYSNNGSGAIDWDTPFSAKQIPLFPNGAGNYGFGYSPFGYGPFGLPWGKNLTRGFGDTPFGYSPFGFGADLITERLEISDCGNWLFGVTCFDALGNEHTGTPNQVSATVHVAPPRPAALQKDSYDADTDILTLTVIDPSSVL